MIHNKYNGARLEKKIGEGKLVAASNNNGYGVLGQRSKQERQKMLQRGSTTPNLGSARSLGVKSGTCTSETCDFWPQCTHRTTITGKVFIELKQTENTR